MKISSITNVLIISTLISISSVLAFANNSKKTLLIFSANWCQYCQVAKNDINTDPKLSEIVKNYEIVELDFDVDKDVVTGYNVKSIPTFIIHENGKELGRKVGYSGGSKSLYGFLK